MKNISKLTLFLFLVFIGVDYSYAYRVDSTLVGSTTGENAGNVVFHSNPDPSARGNWAYIGLNNQFYGNFWIDNVGWATFSHGISGSEVKLDLTTGRVSGFAWSENAGWIGFNNGITNGPNVTYDSVNGVFSGFAWSENMGWISMQGLRLDISEPSINNLKAFAANDNKSFTIIDNGSIGNDFLTSVENWSNSSKLIYLGKTFNHDFRKAKLYNISLTDPSGNNTIGLIYVVANIPSTTLSTNNIGGGVTATNYDGNLTSSKIADGRDKYYFNLHLRDSYGNIIKPEPGVKGVNVAIGFNNNVDINQIGVEKLSSIINIGNLDLGDAINYGANDFLLVNGLVGNNSSFYNSSGDYHFEVLSYAPTKYGYNYTSSNNDINLSYIRTSVTALGNNSGIGEIGNYDPINPSNKGLLKFLPAIEVSTINTNPANWQALFDSWIEYSSVITKNTTENITNFESAYNLDINSMNSLMSFQNLEQLSGTSVCYGYNTLAGYQKTGIKCDRGLLGISNILFNSAVGTNMSQTFRAKPKMVLILLPSFPYTFSSEVVYDMGGYKIAYPSYFYSTNGIQGVTNNEIKITGIMNNSKNNTIIMSGSSLSSKIVGNLARSDIKTGLYKNIERMTKGGKTGNPSVLYRTNSDLTLSSWDYSKNTIIIKGGDVIIDGNILKNGNKLNGIVVLKGSDGKGGNIWIKNNVTKIEAVIYCDGSIISGNKLTNTYYADSNDAATKQLMIFGSLVSSNTIGGSSSSPAKCPYGVNGTCTDEIAKRYDLNHFRHFNPNISPNPDLIYPKYPNAPLIIEYDSNIQTNPLEVFLISNK